LGRGDEAERARGDQHQAPEAILLRQAERLRDEDAAWPRQRPDPLDGGGDVFQQVQQVECQHCIEGSLLELWVEEGGPIESEIGDTLGSRLLSLDLDHAGG
jgi:hypothetical protein